MAEAHSRALAQQAAQFSEGMPPLAPVPLFLLALSSIEAASISPSLSLSLFPLRLLQAIRSY
jgi:ABC-type nitrate/sulfonate/bicarbonate transport system permease component